MSSRRSVPRDSRSGMKPEREAPAVTGNRPVGARHPSSPASRGTLRRIVSFTLIAILPSVPAAAQVVQPSLSEDGSRLTLLDEIRNPPERRQPLIALEFVPDRGSRHIRVAGHGMQAPATVDLRCGARTWRLGRTLLSITPSRNQAFFGVQKETVEALLTWPRCRLLLVGVQIPIPRDLLWAVWRDRSKSDKAPRLLEGDVVSVIGGDSIRVRIQDHIETVRYLGIDALRVRDPTRPEVDSDRAATVINRALVEGQRLRLELDVRERDPDGQLVAYAFAGDLMVNAELVERGYARVMTAPPNVRHEKLFLRLQREAREQKRGLWAERRAEGGAQPHVRRRRLDVAPLDTWTCPATHPIKGKLTGEECTYHIPRGELYNATQANRCYVSEEEARQDGCREWKP